MQQETFLEKLLAACYREESVNIYDVAVDHFKNDESAFTHVRTWAHQLVRSKLAAYVDNEDTILKITNYGKYWMVRGGYFTFLKEEHELKEKRALEKEQHQEKLLEARLKLTHYRLVGFWLAMVISVLGLTLSLFNLYLILSVKG